MHTHIYVCIYIIIDIYNIKLYQIYVYIIYTYIFISEIFDFYLNWLCRTEIFYPSMRALAQRMGTQRDYEVLISGSQSLQPPPGALEVDVKTFQVATLPFNPRCLPELPHALPQTAVVSSASQTAGGHRVRHDPSGAAEGRRRADAGGFRARSTGDGPPDRYRRGLRSTGGEG